MLLHSASKWIVVFIIQLPSFPPFYSLCAAPDCKCCRILEVSHTILNSTSNLYICLKCYHLWMHAHLYFIYFYFCVSVPSFDMVALYYCMIFDAYSFTETIAYNCPAPSQSDQSPPVISLAHKNISQRVEATGGCHHQAFTLSDGDEDYGHNRLKGRGAQGKVAHISPVFRLLWQEGRGHSDMMRCPTIRQTM